MYEFYFKVKHKNENKFRTGRASRPRWDPEGFPQCRNRQK